jgi:hypothetical protein
MVDGCMVRDYREFMNPADLRRSAVTWVAAYAVAIQALLLAFAPFTAMVPADPHAVLCTHDADDSGAPARGDHPCAAICAAMGHGLAALTSPEAVAARYDPQTVPARAMAADWTAHRQSLRGPQVPRGPPLG